MTMIRQVIFAVGVCLFASACGDSGSSPSPVPDKSELSFISQPGDGIGGGRTYHFTSDTARFTHAIDPSPPGSIIIDVQSKDLASFWTVWLGAPAGQQLQVGTYDNAESWTSIPVARPRFSLSGDGRACGGSEGRFVIQTLTYGASVPVSSGAMVPTIERLVVSFAQRCTATSAPGLTGELIFIAGR